MISILASAVRAATNNGPDMVTGGRGVVVVVDITAVPGAQSVTPKIQSLDDVSGKYVDVLVGVAQNGVTTVQLSCGPGVTNSANVSIGSPLADKWRVVMTHSGAGNFTYSVSCCPIP